MIVRIFVPESIYRLNYIVSSKYYYIFGKIVKDNSGDNVSIYIIDVCESNSENTSNQQMIGIISRYTNVIKKLPNDHITFGIDESKTVLELRTVNLPNFIPVGDHFQIQAFLYDAKTFNELSQRNDDQILCQRIDPISKLLLLIKQNENNLIKKNSDVINSDKNTQNRLISFLISFSTFSQTNLSFLNSAFLKHFQFWATNLEKLTHKR